MKAVKRPTSPFVIVPTSDLALPAEEQSRFTVRPLTQEERMLAFDRLAERETRPDGGIIERGKSWQVNRQLLLTHIVAAENFPSDAPRPWPSSGTDQERADYLALMDDTEVMIMGAELFNRSGLEPAVPFSSPLEGTSTSGGNGAGHSSTTARTVRKTRG